MTGAQLVFLGSKRAAKKQLHAQHREKVRRQHLGSHLLGFAGASEAEGVRAIGRDRGEGVVLAAPVEEIGIRDGAFLEMRLALEQHNQFVRVVEWQGVEQNAIHDRENGGVCTDA